MNLLRESQKIGKMLRSNFGIKSSGYSSKDLTTRYEGYRSGFCNSGVHKTKRRVSPMFGEVL